MSELKERFTNIEDWNARKPPIGETLGMNLLKYGNRNAKLSMVVGTKFYNPMSTVHGGILTDLADASMGLATISTLKEGESFTTLELKMNFLRPVYEGELSAEANVVHRGNRIALSEAVLRIGGSEGKVVARGIATQMILETEKDASRVKA